jgi:hypothetical protein
MANPVSYNSVKPLFIVNKYDDIDGGRVAQKTQRGAFTFRDPVTNRLTLPRTLAEAKQAVYPVDWAKPLNPGPYFENGVGLVGTTLYPFNDGSLFNQEEGFAIDPDTLYQTPWPAAIGPLYDIPPAFYNKPVPSGAMCLVYDGEATFTYGSGGYVGSLGDYSYGSKVYVDYASGFEGILTVSGSVAGNTAVGVVVGKNLFADAGNDTITIKIKGTAAL